MEGSACRHAAPACLLGFPTGEDVGPGARRCHDAYELFCTEEGMGYSFDMLVL